MVPVYPGYLSSWSFIGVESVPDDICRSPKYSVRRGNGIHWLPIFVEESCIKGRVAGKPQREHLVSEKGVGWDTVPSHIRIL